MAAPARDLTDRQRDDRVKRCRDLELTVKLALGAGRSALWMMAEALYAFDEESGWTALGYETRAEWLADPEISMTSSTYSRLTRSWRSLVVNRGVDAGRLGTLDLSKVDIVLPAIESGRVSMEDGLEDAGARGARDLREKYVGGGAEAALTGAAALNGTGGMNGATDRPMALTEAQDAWRALEEALTDGLASGAMNPRIPADLIQPGIAGVTAILTNWRNRAVEPIGDIG